MKTAGINRTSVLIVALGLLSCIGRVAFGGANAFQEPSDWTVGDVGSTFQQWEVPFLSSDTPATASQTNPSISLISTMSVEHPGFVGSASGGYYALTSDYQVHANVFNHGGTAGLGSPISVQSSTRVIVQTAASINPVLNVGVFPDSIELVALDGNSIEGGGNESLVETAELFRGEVETPYGTTDQVEFVFEFLLPGYTSDFRLQFLSSIHTNFLELRVDTLIVDSTSTAGDFDGDGDVDANDLSDWQSHYSIDNGADADGDGDSDGADFFAWQRNYTGGSLPSFAAVPEPAAAVLVTYAFIASNLFYRPRR